MRRLFDGGVYSNKHGNALSDFFYYANTNLTSKKHLR